MIQFTFSGATVKAARADDRQLFWIAPPAFFNAPPALTIGGLTKEDWLGLIPNIGNGVLSRRKETNLNHNTSKKLNRKTVTSSLRSETEQKPTPRPSRRTDVRSSPWYEKAAKSIAVSARLSQSFSRDGD